MTEYGRIHTDGSRSGGQPVVTTGLDRSIEQFFFEVGYVACFADAFIKNDVVPFELTDAIIERAWAIAPEAHEDGAEFDRYLAAAQTLRQPTQSNIFDAGDVQKHTLIVDPSYTIHAVEVKSLDDSQPTESDALRDQLLQECLVKLRDVQGTEAPKQYACNLIKRIERVLEEQSK